MGQGTPERAARSTCNAKATLCYEAALSGAMPCGEGYRSAQRQETNQGHRSSIIISKSKNAIGARALYSPPSPPVSSYTWPFIRPRWQSSEQYTEGLHRSVPARGAVLYTGQFRSCIEHKGPPSTKNMHTKDGHDSRGRNYKAETQLPTFAWASLPI